MNWTQTVVIAETDWGNGSHWDYDTIALCAADSLSAHLSMGNSNKSSTQWPSMMSDYQQEACMRHTPFLLTGLSASCSTRLLTGICKERGENHRVGLKPLPKVLLLNTSLLLLAILFAIQHNYIISLFLCYPECRWLQLCCWQHLIMLFCQHYWHRPYSTGV
jgi:hypothetical protein